MEANLANHLAELCRYLLKHFLRRGAPQLFFLEIKQQLQCRVLNFVNLKVFHFDIRHKAYLYNVRNQIVIRN